MPKALRFVFGKTEAALGAAIVITAIVLSLASPYFLTVPNLVDLFEAYSVTTILAAGVFVVLVSGGIDISFTATASAAQYLASTLIVSQGVPAVPALALSALLGIALGSVNALLTYHLRVVSIIVTIATSSIYYALLIYFTDAQEIYNLPDWWSNGGVVLPHETASGDIVKITLPIVMMAVLVALTQYLMSRTRIGRQVYAFGGNPEAASRVGIDILRCSSSPMAISACWRRRRLHAGGPRAPGGADGDERAGARTCLPWPSSVARAWSAASARRRRSCSACLFLRHAAERPQPARRFVLLLRRGHGLAILVSISMTGSGQDNTRAAARERAS
jgi:ribose/xylose/arabinose/galactoside ABC-type transport system permease subunit